MPTDDRAEISAKLIGLLSPRQVGENEFLGEVTPEEHSLGRGRVYGGLVAAQATAASELTVPPGRPTASIHCRFLREGDEARPIRYQVMRDMDGGSISHRRVVADQGNGPILTFSAMLHRPGEAVRHQPQMPAVPSPETVRAELEAMGDAMPYALGRFLAMPRMIEVLPVDHAVLDSRRPNLAPFRVWLRPSAIPAADPLVRRAMLVYASDAVLLLSATLRHGMVRYRSEIQGATIDHSLWIHDEFAADEWLLYEVECPWSGASRGLTRGHLFARDGRLVASAAQEGLLRLM